MPDYQKLYSALFNKVTNVIIELQEIQQITEMMYITDGEDQGDGD